MVECQAVTVFVSQDITQTTRIVAGAFEERIGRVDHHVAVVREIIERQDAEVAVNVAARNANVRPNAGRPATRWKRRRIVGRFVDIRVARQLTPTIKHLHEQRIPCPVRDVRAAGRLVVDRVQTTDQVARRRRVGGSSIRQKTPGQRGRIAPLQARSIRRRPRPTTGHPVPVRVLGCVLVLLVLEYLVDVLVRSPRCKHRNGNVRERQLVVNDRDQGQVREIRSSRRHDERRRERIQVALVYPACRGPVQHTRVIIDLDIPDSAGNFSKLGF